MNITKNDIDSLNAEIVISVVPADYEVRVGDALKKAQKQIWSTRQFWFPSFTNVS